MVGQDIISFIETRRKELAISQNDIANKIGYSSQLISNWSKGKSLPDLSIIYLLGNILQLSIDEIFSCSENKDASFIKNKPFDIKAFSSTLKKIRLLNSITQKELGNKMDVSYATIIAWEKGTSTPNIVQFISLCKIFTISYTDLYYGHFVAQVSLDNKKKNFKKPLIISLSFLIFCGALIGGIIGFKNIQNNPTSISLSTSLSEPSVVPISIKPYRFKYFDDDYSTLLCTSFVNKLGEKHTYDGNPPFKPSTENIVYEFVTWNIAQPEEIPSKYREEGDLYYYVAEYNGHEVSNSNDFVFGNYNEENKTCSVTKYNGTEKKVVIPGTKDGYKVIAIDNNCFENNLNIENIIIPPEIIIIKSSAFKNCSKLKKIVFPETLETVENNVFENCIGINSITFPKKTKNIYPDCFLNCSALVNVTLPEKMNTLHQLFVGCTSMKVIEVTYGVTILDSSFCDSCIGRATLPETITTIGSKSYYNMPATIIYLPDSVKTIDANAFDSTKRKIFVPKNLSSWAFDDSLMYNETPGSEYPEIYFKGNKEDWSKINFTLNTPNMKGEGNIHFYSETFAINCWHYKDSVPCLY